VQNSQIIGKILIRLLRPIAQLALSSGIQLPEIEQALKLALLDAVSHEIYKSGGTPNVSRLSIASGINRREVSKLWKNHHPNVNRLPILVRVIGLWQNSSKFINKNGTPRTLTYEGMKSEFFTLVASVSKDINPYTVLSELERAELVVKSKRGLKLTADAYQPTKDLEASLNILTNDQNDLLKAVGQNIFEREKIPNLHLRTEYDNIPETDLPKIRRWLLKEGVLLHRKIRKFLSSYDRDFSKKRAKNSSSSSAARVALSSFSITEKEE
jgi:hypothetical protein